MAKRPIFCPANEGAQLVTTHLIDFKWHSGMAKSQAQKSIAELHRSAATVLSLDEILEISSKSPLDLGVHLSAFNLMITTVKLRQTFSLECAFQASKVFEHGGPFVDLLSAKSIDAKRDPRLRNSGKLIAFQFFGVSWKLLPRTAFYDWLYINALHKQPALADQVLSYRAFSDIAFNPDRSINCQAYAAALYVSLHDRGLLTPRVLADRDSYLEVVTSFGAGNTRSEANQDDAFGGA